MAVTARLAAARAVQTVLGQGGYSNLVLDHILEKEGLSTQDRSFCAALLYTTVQRLLTLDYAIDSCSAVPAKKLSPGALAALRTGFCQLLFMPGVPQSAAVNETVTVVKELGEPQAAGFVNGVLRTFVRRNLTYPTPKDALTALSIRYSVPMPLIQLWRKSYGHANTLAILEGFEAPPPVFVRVNPLKTTALALITRLAEEGLTAAPVEGMPHTLGLDAMPGGVARLGAFREGLFHVQDLSSQRCMEAAGIRQGQRLLDVCAAPGGKSFTAAELMENRGTVVARDLYPARVGLIAEGAARLGLTSIASEVADAAVFVPGDALFDHVLCDVLCSGFGILRRKPEIRYKPLETLDALPDLQYNILNTSAQYCAPGGRLIYSTCTLRPAENEQVAERFLTEHSGFRLVGEPNTVFPGEGDGFFYTILEKNK